MEEVGADHDDDDDRSVEIRVVITSISTIPSYIPKLSVLCAVAISSKVQKEKSASINVAFRSVLFGKKNRP